MHDIQYALRGFRRSPGVVLTVIITIGLALGLNTTMFTIFNAYVLRPFEVRDPYSLYNLAWATKNGRRSATYAELDQIRQKAAALEQTIFIANSIATVQGHPM